MSSPENKTPRRIPIGAPEEIQNLPKPESELTVEEKAKKNMQEFDRKFIKGLTEEYNTGKIPRPGANLQNS